MSLSLKAVSFMAILGWGFAAYETIAYLGLSVKLEATKAQVALDANKAAEEAVQALQAAHEQELKDLRNQLKANQLAAAAAQEQKTRLLLQLSHFKRELEGLADEARAYLNQPVPGAVRDSLRDAQHRNQTEGN